MIQRLFSSLFFRLYASIIGALMLVAIAFYLIWQFQEDATSIEDFVNDTNHKAFFLTGLRQKFPNQWNELAEYLQFIDFQTASIKNEAELNKMLSRLELIATEGGVPVYLDIENNLLHAIYSLKDEGLWLVIADMPHDASYPGLEKDFLEHLMEEENEDRRFRQTILMATIALLSVIGLIVLATVHKLSMQINNMSRSSREFATGKLSSRMDGNIPSPLNEIANSFNQMAVVLENSINEKDIMSNAISHELRTPLTRLRLAIGLAQSKLDRDEVNSLLQDMSLYMDELDQLTSTILTIAKLNHRSNAVLNIEDISLTELVEERIESFTSLETNKTISNRLPENINLSGDRRFMQMALDNLIKNAVAYAASLVEVSVSHAKNNNIRILVEDDGPGIPEDQVSKIFLPFARSESSRDRMSGGFGLGLAIVSSIATRHDGRVSLEKSKLGGACFVLEIPAQVIRS